ncbi:MOSC domain-containing protein [Roseibacterium sp. SDUM158017]|uniref:MOSC domain-containing protein n=1 Tax=Roseicyclus salinarum TaxID=3036773 RepID=UPI00241591B6|nr:MOSC domain-containing protein [Roseibacterium sp. SDUM158017]MDG4647072.1 MOSC domain-containing protein [Roseibacterium sp. SDUM158017]
METIASLTARHARSGRLERICLRPARRTGVTIADSAEIAPEGLRGDHGHARKRAVTLIQAEHLPVIAALAGLEDVAPGTLRRNLVISGINLSALRGRAFRLGGAVLQITGPCAPCSRMEEALGPGGYNAMRGHGGWCAEVIRPGSIAVGDMLRPVDA